MPQLFLIHKNAHTMFWLMLIHWYAKLEAEMWFLLWCLFPQKYHIFGYNQHLHISKMKASLKTFILREAWVSKFARNPVFFFFTTYPAKTSCHQKYGQICTKNKFLPEFELLITRSNIKYYPKAYEYLTVFWP